MVSDSGHLKAEADEARFDEIVDRADERAPNDHENAPGGVIGPNNHSGRATAQINNQ